jgi:hypothetical protein
VYERSCASLDEQVGVSSVDSGVERDSSEQLTEEGDFASSYSLCAASNTPSAISSAVERWLLEIFR